MSAREPLNEVVATESDLAAVRECLESGWLTMGPRTQRLEGLAVGLLGVRHAVAASSGGAALDLAFRAIGVAVGDRVAVPAIAPLATAQACMRAGAKVDLCDSLGACRPAVDPCEVERALDRGARAVVIGHPWGYVDRADEVEGLCEERDVPLVEYVDGAIGAVAPDGRAAGQFGTVGCIDFATTSQVPVGEAGLLVTDNESLAAVARSLRSHAMTSVTWERHRGHGLGYDISDIGYNYRIDEPRSALTASRLEAVGDEIDRRRTAATAYAERIDSAGSLLVPFDRAEMASAAHGSFGIGVADGTTRDELASAMAAAGVETAMPTPLYRHPLLASNTGDVDYSAADELSERVLLLPMHGCLTVERVERICDALLAHSMQKPAT